MPLYEYSCQKCHRDLEVMRKLADPPLKKCPECGGKLVKKLSATSFQLKGGGWYKDGYSSPSTPEKPKGEATKGGETGTKSSEPTVKSESSKSESGKSVKGKN